MVRYARLHEAHRRRAGPKKIAPRPCRMANLKSFGAANVRAKISPLMHNPYGHFCMPENSQDPLATDTTDPPVGLPRSGSDRRSLKNGARAGR
jgi:hypothetical protein